MRMVRSSASPPVREVAKQVSKAPAAALVRNWRVPGVQRYETIHVFREEVCLDVDWSADRLFLECRRLLDLRNDRDGEPARAHARDRQGDAVYGDRASLYDVAHDLARSLELVDREPVRRRPEREPANTVHMAGYEVAAQAIGEP